MNSKLKTQNSKLKTLRIPLEMLSSREFLIWVMGGWVVYYIFSAIWLKESFGNFAEGLQNNRLIQIPFFFFLLSGYLNLIRSSGRAFRKGRIRFFAWLALPLGGMLFLTGFFISLSTRQFEWIVVGEGQDVTPRWGSERYKVAGIRSGLKDRFLDIDIGAGMGIFRYEPELDMLDKSLRKYTVGVFPPTRIGDTYCHILNFGLAPGVALTQGGDKKDEGYIPLRIIGPGSSDYFELPPYPYRFLISLEPEKIIQKGNLRASRFNLKNPLYSVKVYKGEKVIARGDSRDGIGFEGLMLNFHEPVTWVQLELVKDYGYPVILSGIFLISAGIPLLFLKFISELWIIRKYRG